MMKSLWTEDNVVNSPCCDVEIPNVTIPEYIWRNVDKWSDKTAVVCGVTNRSFTYNQLYEYSRNFAISLRTRFQIKEDDVVGIMMPNAIEYPIAILGALQAGAVVTTFNPIYKASEVYRQLLLSKPKLIVTAAEIISVIQEAIDIINSEIITVVVTYPDITVKEMPVGVIPFEELISHQLNTNVLNNGMRNSHDVALLLYSSGTTGLPKGVELTHRNFVANFVQQEGLRHVFETTNQHQDTILGVLPFHHIYGISRVLLFSLAFGAKLIILPRFQSKVFLNTLKNYKIDVLYVVPYLASFLASHHDVKKEHLVSVDRIFTGAAPLTKSDVSKVLEKFQLGTKLLNLYGLTEVSPIVTSSAPSSCDYIETAGFAISNTQLRVVDDNNRNLGPGQVGELYIQGPQLMKGYRDNLEATQAAITDDGWFRSGDLVSISNDGGVTVVGRIKEIIKVKGYQVSPVELENILKEHPDVEDVAVVGIPDDKIGELPKAFIVLKEGHEATADDIKDFINKNVSEYKYIREVEFMNDLPRDISGKILRRVLMSKHVM